jgi:hypothetical protein
MTHRLDLRPCGEGEAGRSSQSENVHFFPGLHQPSDAHHFDLCMVSYARLRRRVSDFAVQGWMLDSGAFSEISQHGHYRDAPEVYAAAIVRWAQCGTLLAAVSQDWMCEPHILAKTGLTVAEHQRLTIERYDELRALVPPHIHLMPVIQGYLPEQYVTCIRAYGDRITPGMWVGVGSVCKRNGNPRDIAAVLRAIAHERPDLCLHGFGCKQTAIGSASVRRYLASADSMAWSLAARYQNPDPKARNDWREAARYTRRVQAPPSSTPLPMDDLWR